MHDNRVEDTLRSVLRREGDELTVNITAQELERRLALRRRARAGRRLSLIAAGIAVITIGGIVGVSNGWFGSPPAIGGRPASSGQVGVPAASVGSAQPPDASPATGQTPSPRNPVGCEAVDPSAASGPPIVGAGVVPGDALGHDGSTVAYQWNGTTVGTPGMWNGVPAEMDPLVIDANDQVIEIVSHKCLQDVMIDALLTVYAEVPKPSPTPIALTVLRGEGTPVVDIAPPLTGGWTIRVRAAFTTTDGSPAWSETLFRVFVSFDAPKLLMSQGAGVDSRSATANCPSYKLTNGASASDQCGGPYEPITGIDPLAIAKGSAVELTLSDDWRIDQARVAAVQADLVQAGKNAPEHSVAFVDQGGLKLTVLVVLDPGSWIVRVSLNGSKGGDTFGAYYDLPVTIGPQ